MGEKNIAINGFLSDKARFADLFNAFYFEGEQCIASEDLMESSEQYREVKRGRKRKGMERVRDVKMQMKNGGALRILAIESQNLVDYTMPLRCMQYDCMEYSKQLQKQKKHNAENGNLHTPAEKMCVLAVTDRLDPVYTLCLYHGEEEWNGPRTLKDMMRFADDDGMKEYFNDYPLKLFCVNEQDDFDMLQTDLREVFMALNCRKDKQGIYQLMQQNERYRQLDEEAVHVMAVLLDMPTLWEEREKYLAENEEKEEYNMCQAIRELIEDGRIEGRAEGRAATLLVAGYIYKQIQEGRELVNDVMAEKCQCSVEDVEAVRAAFEI